MYEPRIYDARDRESDHPESVLPSMNTPAGAWAQVFEYINDFAKHSDVALIYKVEVIDLDKEAAMNDINGGGPSNPAQFDAGGEA